MDAEYNALQNDPDVIEAMTAASAHLRRAKEAAEKAYSVLAEMTDKALERHRGGIGIKVEWMVIRNEVMPLDSAVEAVFKFVTNGSLMVDRTLEAMKRGDEPEVEAIDRAAFNRPFPEGGVRRLGRPRDTNEE